MDCCALPINHSTRDESGNVGIITGGMSVERVFNLSMGLVQRLLEDTVDHIRKGLSMAKNGVNAFKIDQHWMDPDRSQPRAN